MRRITLILVLGLSVFVVSGCGKVKLGDPVAFPGTGEVFGESEGVDAPMFKNGDVVRYKMLSQKKIRGSEKVKRGIVMHCDYKYIPRLKTYYCIVDFYPPSAGTFSSSDFNKYERRYVYEYELELEENEPVPVRWAWMNK